MYEKTEALTRWRLVLGEAAEASLTRLSESHQRADAALEWLYGRSEDGERQQGPRRGGQGRSQLTVPDWINEIHQLFPRETIERLERDAIENYGIAEIVTNPDVLARVKPNETLLKAVLQTKHLMNEKVLAAARVLVRQVVAQLMNALAKEIRSRFSGVMRRHRSRRFPREGALHLKRTILGNLKHYDPKEGKICPERTWFFERSSKRLAEWQIILLVDQSGSMLDSTIHAAITAAIFSSLPGVKSHLIAFDTEVVDLTQDVHDPVKTLMQVQLGGGTCIAKAVAYGASLIRSTGRAIVVIISDFFEGDQPGKLESQVRALSAQGTQVLGLAALDRGGHPIYNRDLAEKLVEAGAEVAAMTPGELATWFSEKVRRS